MRSARKQQFLFVCLSERLRPNSPEQLEELDRRMEDMDAGRKKLSLAEFEHRLNAGTGQGN